jgi:predicted nucleotidyltransferase
MVTDKNVIQGKIEQFIEQVNQHVTVDKVILYGSWVNGTPTEYSDIDLAIFSPDFGKHKLKELQLLSRLAWEVDVAIEAIPYSTEQFLSDDPTKFVYKIIQTGEIVYDRALMH